MYDQLKDILLELFQAPKEPPEPPTGKHESVRVFRASLNYLSYQYVFFFLGLFVLGLVFLGAIIGLFQVDLLVGTISIFLLILLWFCIAIGGYFIIRLEYDMRYYILTDRSLRVRKGVLTIVEQTMTFVNIQNIKVSQGPVERMYGISSLIVETAGGGGTVSPEQGGGGPNYHRAVLSGLENAESVRDLIRNYLTRLPQTSGLGNPEDPEYHLPAAVSHGFSPREIQALREILQEVKELRLAVGR